MYCGKPANQYGLTISPGCEVHHTCGIRSCVNPAHLKVVTHRENIRLTAA